MLPDPPRRNRGAEGQAHPVLVHLQHIEEPPNADVAVGLGGRLEQDRVGGAEHLGLSERHRGLQCHETEQAEPEVHFGGLFVEGQGSDGEDIQYVIGRDGQRTETRTSELLLVKAHADVEVSIEDEKVGHDPGRSMPVGTFGRPPGRLGQNGRCRQQAGEQHAGKCRVSNHVSSLGDSKVRLSSAKDEESVLNKQAFILRWGARTCAGSGKGPPPAPALL